MKRINIIFLFLVLFLAILFSPKISFAKTDLSITEGDITFSNPEPLDGETIKVYARIFNSGDNDVSGNVIFSDKGKKIGDLQPISLKPNTYDDVFILWKVKTGTYDILAKIVNLDPVDDNIDNNETVKKNFFIDLDTDSDGEGNKKDLDDDNDGLTDEEEIAKGTNPLSPDTDGDKINDKIDLFPADKTEWRDTDSDGSGDNKDMDADGDGLTNQEETQKYGTNPLSQDSDSDGFNDKQEIQTNTDPNKQDAEDNTTNPSPINVNKMGASLMDSVAGLMNSKNSFYYILGVPTALLIMFLLFRKKKKRR